MIFNFCPACQSEMIPDGECSFACPNHQHYFKFRILFDKYGDFAWVSVFYVTNDWQYDIYVYLHEIMIYTDNYHRDAPPRVAHHRLQIPMDIWNWQDIKEFKQQINSVLAFS